MVWDDLKIDRQASLAELSDEEIVAACEQNYIDYWRCVGTSANAEFSEDGGVTRCITGLRQDIMNVVLKCELDPSAIDSQIDELVEELRPRRVPVIWHTGILSEPKEIGKYLEARGFPHDYDLAAMAVDLAVVGGDVGPPEGVSARVVQSESDCRVWVACLVESWQSPKEAAPWFLNNACFSSSASIGKKIGISRNMYLGSLNGEPAGAAMLVWSNHIAGLQTVGTIPSAMRKGVGSAVVRAALTDARRMGFRYVVVLSTVEGVSLYRRSGFKEFGKLPEHSMDFQIR